jgi:hypothetical protein
MQQVQFPLLLQVRRGNEKHSQIRMPSLWSTTSVATSWHVKLNMNTQAFFTALIFEPALVIKSACDSAHAQQPLGFAPPEGSCVRWLSSRRFAAVGFGGASQSRPMDVSALWLFFCAQFDVSSARPHDRK